VSAALAEKASVNITIRTKRSASILYGQWTGGRFCSLLVPGYFVGQLCLTRLRFVSDPVTRSERQQPQ